MIGLFGKEIKDEKVNESRDYYFEILHFLKDNPTGCRYDKIRKKFSNLTMPEITRLIAQLRATGYVDLVDGLYFYSKKRIK